MANDLRQHFVFLGRVGLRANMVAGAEAVFANGSKAATSDTEADKAELFEQIGRLKMELEWLKKSRTDRLTGSGCWLSGTIRT